VEENTGEEGGKVKDTPLRNGEDRVVWLAAGYCRQPGTMAACIP